MKLYRDEFSGWQLDITKRIFVTPSCEWLQLRPGYNWRTFHLLHVMYEQDASLASHVFEVIILGFGIYLRINGDWNKTQYGRDLLQAVDALHKGGK